MHFGIKPLQGAGNFGETLEAACLAEALGFDSVYISEHHRVADNIYPAPSWSRQPSRRVRLWIGTLSPSITPPRGRASRRARRALRRADVAGRGRGLPGRGVRRLRRGLGGARRPTRIYEPVGLGHLMSPPRGPPLGGPHRGVTGLFCAGPAG